jgi:hypothetical protein
VKKSFHEQKISTKFLATKLKTVNFDRKFPSRTSPVRPVARSKSFKINYLFFGAMKISSEKAKSAQNVPIAKVNRKFCKLISRPASRCRALFVSMTEVIDCVKLFDAFASKA